MPSSRFVSDIQKSMSEAVASGDIDAAKRICNEMLAVELGQADASDHLERMIRHYQAKAA